MTQIAAPPRQANQSRLAAMLPMLLLDVALPTGSYYVLSALGMSDVLALTIGGLLSGLRVLYTVIRDRKIDGFAAFVLATFVIGIALAFVTGDARFVLAKDSFGTAIAGLYILATCVVGKPFMYSSALRFRTAGDPEAAATMRGLYRNSAAFRRMLRLLSLMWGCGLLAESALRLVLVYQLPVATMVTISPILLIATIGLLIPVTMRFARKMANSAIR